MCVRVCVWYAHMHSHYNRPGAGVNSDELGPTGLWCVLFQCPAGGSGHPRDHRLQLDHSNTPPSGPGTTLLLASVRRQTGSCVLLFGSLFIYFSALEIALLYSLPEARYFSVISFLICCSFYHNDLTSNSPQRLNSLLQSWTPSWFSWLVLSLYPENIMQSANFIRLVTFFNLWCCIWFAKTCIIVQNATNCIFIRSPTCNMFDILICFWSVNSYTSHIA